MTDRFVVLLRGVNAGPKNRIRMPELQAALTNAGFSAVRTHAQSGNVVLAHHGNAADVEAKVRELLTTRFALDADVVVRDERSFRAVAADNPLRDVASDPRRHFVVFCSHPHDTAKVPVAVPPEVLIARPMELHLWCPNGAQQSKLMPALGRCPPAPITTRNWNTVATLAHRRPQRPIRPTERGRRGPATCTRRSRCLRGRRGPRRNGHRRR